METNLKENSNIFTKNISPLLRWLFILAVGFALGYAYYSFTSSEEDTTIDQEEVAEDIDCNVMDIIMNGSLMTYIPKHAEGDTNFVYDSVSSENVIYSIKGANEDPKIKAIIIEVDSSGGSPVAGEEISNAVKNSDKPVFVTIRDIGASASYWAISSADKIWASKNSDVGSIGVTMSYLNNADSNKKEGYKFEQLSVGKFKDSGSPDVPLTKEEKDLFMRDLNIIYQNFMEAVSLNRNIPIEKVKSFADGSTVLGDKAKELGLIDEIGGMNEAKKYIEEQIGEKPIVCVYE
jgi:protease-4